MRYCFLLLWLLLSLPARAQPAGVPAPAAGPACHDCSFSDAIDAQIEAAVDAQLAARPSDPGPTSLTADNLLELMPPPLPPTQDNLGSGYVRSKAVGWSAWSQNYHWLSWYLYRPDWMHWSDSYLRPLRLPTASGRLLYLASANGSSPYILVEFVADRFRVIVLTMELTGHVVSHAYYRHPDAELLVLRHDDGFDAPGAHAHTNWLSIYDFQQDKWLLDTVVEAYTELGTDEYAERQYQVKDAGRTLVLGRYRSDLGKFRDVELPLTEPPQMARDLPLGTYRLVNGRYRPAASAAKATAVKPQATPTAPRAAVSAAEVNGTFRDARGREWQLLALGGGRLRVSYHGELSRVGAALGRPFMRGEATIQADSAVFEQRTVRPCTLRLRFVRPGLLQVRAAGPGCDADAAGSYPKVSDAKPDFE